MRSYGPLQARAVSEPVFVPRPQSVREGDGWLLCIIHDENTDRGQLAVFDAQHVAHGPIARAQLPWRVPMGFHGTWVAA